MCNDRRVACPEISLAGYRCLCYLSSRKLPGMTQLDFGLENRGSHGQFDFAGLLQRVSKG